jgi:hypothetical protein
MIDRSALLSDLQSLLTKLEDDLRERSGSAEVPEVAAWLKQEYAKAKNSERTALTEPQWIEETGTQVAVAWVLSCVFARFSEDNELTEPARIAGPGERLERARDEYTLFFEKPEHAQLTDREYLLSLFRDLAVLPGLGDLFGKHNMLMQLPEWLGPDAAGELIRFFQRIDSETGKLIHDFTDSDWNTRFLGDLYQDLSEKARKKFALLQTPDFVEEFILDRTLEPALDEFGVDAAAVEREGKRPTEPGFRMIDPACGSGHFLLGAFPRILKRWQEKEPGTNVRELVQRTLTSIHGVDINPFAVAIARFRLLLVALAECGIKRMKDAPDFQLQLACGDSLYHGRQQQLTLDGLETDESHYFKSEDAEEVGRILREGTFHAVVANPPYIVPKDKAANSTYRRLYKSCHMKYSLAAPFMERIFQLATRGKEGESSGYTGQITANSFMKREFGKKLIENFFPSIDLQTVIDTSGAFIPGHATPTLIIFGRNRSPVLSELRAVMGVRGERATPDIPALGHVWQAILTGIDNTSSQLDYVDVRDLPRTTFLEHPWSMTGGGAVECRKKIESAELTLSDLVEPLGFTTIPCDDEIYVMPSHAAARGDLPSRPFITGELLRDWAVFQEEVIVFPYVEKEEFIPIALTATSKLAKHFWQFRTNLRSRIMFGKTPEGHGLKFFEYMQFIQSRALARVTIGFPNVASHNQFAFISKGWLPNQNVNIVQLSDDEQDYDALLAFLNSSTVCFWMKQVCHQKQMMGGESIRIESKSKVPHAFSATAIGRLPVPATWRESKLREQLARLGKALLAALATQVPRKAMLANRGNTAITEVVNEYDEISAKARGKSILLQEEIDFIVYKMFRLTEENCLFEDATKIDIAIGKGERPFCIRDGNNEEGYEVPERVPDHWPSHIRDMWKFRLELIDKCQAIKVIEDASYKRRWIGRQGKYNHAVDSTDANATFKDILLARLESYFDFDDRMLDEADADDGGDEDKDAADQNAKHALYGTLGDSAAPKLVSLAQLADTAARDTQFMEVGEVYRDDSAFDVQRLVEELVKGEHVPLLPVLRYKPAGMRKRAEWETTWQLQRLEDELRAGKPLDEPRVAALIKDCQITPDQCQQIENWQKSTPEDDRTDTTLPSARVLDKILAIPVPPKYKSSDFISTGGARYWALRGKLDVPKERWISLPHCDANDGTLMLCWAGYDHLQQAGAIATYYTQVKQELGGSDDPRLLPLLACLRELIGWLKQWHNELDAKFNLRMGDYYHEFVINEARELGKTTEDLEAWTPPKTKKKKATKKKIQAEVSA